MATSREAAKSPAAIKDEVRTSILHFVRESIEANIQIHGQSGFEVDAGYEYRRAKDRDVAMAAIYELVDEYRRAGWRVECSTYESQYHTPEVILKFR